MLLLILLVANRMMEYKCAIQLLYGMNSQLLIGDFGSGAFDVKMKVFGGKLFEQSICNVMTSCRN